MTGGSTLLSLAAVHRQLHRSWWDAVHSMVSQVARHMPAWAHPVERALLIVTFAVLALAIVRGWLQWRTRHQPTVTYALIPPAEVKLEQTAWLMFYRRLFGISAPWWKRLVSGQPWLSLEFWSANGRVSARCWFPDGSKLSSSPTCA